VILCEKIKCVEFSIFTLPQKIISKYEIMNLRAPGKGIAKLV